ncbi:MAG: hypothetical protein O2821_03560 [Chloroflexi bacterium]|nr:hypothetical protein [Chloroflexota bacterium]MDA1228328.1 hypothetical protein [Chloroflexota bacterium]
MNKPKAEMSSQQRVAAARARAKREAAEPGDETSTPTEAVEEPSDE